MAMMAMTTSSSIKVNPACLFIFIFSTSIITGLQAAPPFPDPTSIKTALSNLCDAFLMEKMLPLHKVYFDFEED